MFLCHLQCLCPAGLHQCWSYHCPGTFPLVFTFISLSDNTPDTIYQFFHPLCTLWLTSASSSPSILQSRECLHFLTVNGSLRLGARCTQVFSIISTDLQSSLFHCSSQFIKLYFYMLSSSMLPSTIISSTNSIHQRSCYLM